MSIINTTILFNYLRDAGAQSLDDKIISTIRDAQIKGTGVQELSIALVRICFPRHYSSFGDTFHWAFHNNIDIQVAEMLGKAGYPVGWTDEEYSYY